MTNLSEIYDVTLKRGNREAAKGGFVRPTIGEHFMTHRDFEQVVKPLDPIFLTKLLAPDGAASDFFGYSVVSNGNIIAVGAPQTYEHYTYSGAVYLYNEVGDYITKLVATNIHMYFTYDRFGYSLAMSGTKLVVGAVDYAYGQYIQNSGTAYLYNTDGSGVIQLNRPSPQANDHFGNAVAISGDKIVVGASEFGNGTYATGAVFIFDTNGSYVDTIVSTTNNVSCRFGSSVAIDTNKIVVGSSTDEVAGISSGTVHIFNTSGGSYIRKIKSPETASGDRFGNTISLTNDKILIGAYMANDPYALSGAAYIFDSDGEFITKLVAPDLTENSYFGKSISASNGLIFVGAPGVSNGAGAVYIFTDGGSFIFKVTPSSGSVSDSFGYSVGAVSDRLVVGAYLDDGLGVNAGSAYVYGI